MSRRTAKTFDPFAPLAQRAAAFPDTASWEEWCRAFDIYADIINARVHAFPDFPISSAASAPGSLLCSYKDVIAVQRLKSRFGSDVLSIIPDRSAPIVSFLETNGAYTLGKVRTSEFGVGENNHACVNPLFQDYTTSGSSNGSAAAVAAGLSDFSVGTDAAGSVRRPAAFCGSVGLLLSASETLSQDVMAVSASFDRLGLIARSCDDLAHIWEHCRLELICDQAPTNIREMKLAVPQLPDNVNREIAAAFDHYIHQAKVAGIVIDTIDYPLLEHRRSAWKIIGYETVQWSKTLENCLHRGWMLPNNRLMLECAAKLTADEYQEALGIRDEVSRDIVSIFTDDGYFGIILPIEPNPAPLVRIPPAVNMFPFDALDGEVDRLSYSILANLYNLIGISYPIAMSAAGYPIGVQILTQPNREKRLIDAARMLHATLPEWIDPSELSSRRSVFNNVAKLAQDRTSQGRSTHTSGT